MVPQLLGVSDRLGSERPASPPLWVPTFVLPLPLLPSIPLPLLLPPPLLPLLALSPLLMPVPLGSEPQGRRRGRVAEYPTLLIIWYTIRSR